jgi:hypothetical protein
MLAPDKTLTLLVGLVLQLPRLVGEKFLDLLFLVSVPTLGVHASSYTIEPPHECASTRLRGFHSRAYLKRCNACRVALSNG